MVKSGQALTFQFPTVGATGALTNADSTPTCTMYVDGTADGGSVTVTNSATGRYKAACTVPTLTAGQCFEVWAAFAVATVNGGGIVYRQMADTAYPLKPTTDGRTLDVSSGGEAGVDWANVGTPGSTVALSATTIATATTLTNAPSDSSGVTTLLSRLTSTRAGYLDNLSAGAVALQSTLTTVAGYIDTEVATIITNIAALPAAVWDRLTSALTTVGSIGAWILANAGSGASPATFWAYASRTLTQGAASVATAVSGSSVTTYRGTRWSVSLTGLPSYSTTTYTSIIVAIKRSTEDTDADSIVYIRKNRTGSPADGLIYFDGITSPTGAHASITADSATAITIVLEGAASQYATPGQYQYGVKILDASGYPVAESEGGSWIIVGDTPRAVS